MKAILTIAAICAIAIITIATQGCSKSSNTNTAAADSAYMKATIQGLAFSATGPNGAYAGSSPSAGITTLSIYGVSTSGQAIRIDLINNTGVGYNALATANASAYFFAGGGLQGSSSSAVSGSVTLTSVAPLLVGTFSFTTNDVPAKTISRGTFSMPAP